MVCRENSIAVLLASSCLAVTLFVAISTSSSPEVEYDPWVDINNDGKINILDISIVAVAFGAEGQSITRASMQYDSGWIDLTGETSQYHELTHNLNLAAIDMIVDARHTQKTQELNNTYGGKSDDVAYSLVQTVDGGYALAGATRSFGVSELNFYLVETDVDGNMLWNKTYGEASYGYSAESLVQTDDGGYALAGLGAGNCYLIRTDVDGNMLWNMTYGGTASDDVAYSLVQTVDGGYALAGTTGSFGVGNWDFYLVETDVDGNMLWNMTYGGASLGSLAVALSLVQTFDGGYALAGAIAPHVETSYDFYLVKTEGESGVAWFSSTMDSITLVRGATTTWGFVRVQIWKKR